MPLSSPSFFVFFVAVCALFWTAYRARRVQVGLLLAANLFFLAKFGLVYLLLPLAACVDFGVGKAIAARTAGAVRKAWLGVSLALNLGLLVGFKLLPLMKNQRWGWLVTLSLSFYCFQALTYTIDIYRGDAKAEPNLLTYLAGALFFPVILAGPIPRMGKLLRQLNLPFKLTREAGATALLLIATGLVKKLLVADYLADNFVNRVFDTPLLYSGVENLLAVYGYALQLFFDFSGYTDIAMGAALLLGIAVPENFRTPYLAANLQDFWKRWHISFSSWLTDYLFESLPKSRAFPPVTYAYAFVVTFLLGGLWHGITWNFLIWGALHGFGLWSFYLWATWRRRTSAAKAAALGATDTAGSETVPFRDARRPLPPKSRGKGSVAGQIVGALLTFHFVCLTWVFFRAADVAGALAVLRQIGSHTWGLENVSLPLAGVMVFAALAHCIPQGWFDGSAKVADRLPVWVQGAALAVVVLLIQALAGQGAAGFVYGNF